MIGNFYYFIAQNIIIVYGTEKKNCGFKNGVNKSCWLQYFSQHSGSQMEKSISFKNLYKREYFSILRTLERGFDLLMN